MTDSPATRQSLLARLKDPRDERGLGRVRGDLYAAHRPPGTSQRVAIGGCRRPRAGGLSGRGRGDRPLRPGPARGSFRSWLFRIARNLMINLLAARRVRPQATGDSEVQELLDRVPAPDGAGDRPL